MPYYCKNPPEANLAGLDCGLSGQVLHPRDAADSLDYSDIPDPRRASLKMSSLSRRLELLDRLALSHCPQVQEPVILPAGAIGHESYREIEAYAINDATVNTETNISVSSRPHGVIHKFEDRTVSHITRKESRGEALQRAWSDISGLVKGLWRGDWSQQYPSVVETNAINADLQPSRRPEETVGYELTFCKGCRPYDGRRNSTSKDSDAGGILIFPTTRKQAERLHKMATDLLAEGHGPSAILGSLMTCASENNIKTATHWYFRQSPSFNPL